MPRSEVAQGNSRKTKTGGKTKASRKVSLQQRSALTRRRNRTNAALNVPASLFR